MNINLWKYALPLLATAVAATVGIWMRPQTPANPESTARQTVASSARDTGARLPSNECPDAARQSAPARSNHLDDLLHGCDDEDR